MPIGVIQRLTHCFHYVAVGWRWKHGFRENTEPGLHEIADGVDVGCISDRVFTPIVRVL